MCPISDSIQLCTCSSAESLKNYWIFHRYIRGRFEIVVGEVIFDFPHDPETDAQNIDTLLRQLNAGNPFDVDLQPKNLDRLSLHFDCGKPYDTVSYGFRYTGKYWVNIDYDGLSWYTHHVPDQEGTIINALTETNSNP